MFRRDGSRFRARCLLAVLIAGAILSARTSTAQDGAAKKIKTHPVIEPAAPILPATVVSSMQEGKYDAAIVAIDRLVAESKTPNEKQYLALIKGVAEKLANRPDAARRVWNAAVAENPRGTWATKIRFESAVIDLAAGRHAAAEALARTEAEFLLSGDRKDRLAEVYRSFARRLLSPDDPVSKPDPEGAYALLVQARSLAKGEAIRAKLLESMAAASRAAQNHERAIQDAQAYLKEYPKGPDRDSLRYHIGASRLAQGQVVPARVEWTDLARDLEKKSDGDSSKLRSQALLGIARTYGVPRPPGETELNLGAAALKRFLAAYPNDPAAVQAAFDVGSSYLARGKSQEALQALTLFIKGEGFRAASDAAKQDLARLSPTATYLIGQVLFGQRKYEEAVNAWKGYLAQYPNGPQSAQAQRSMLDAELAMAEDLLRKEKYADARSAWLAFVGRNPLDGRVPQLLFRTGATFETEKKFDEAIASWETLIGKFPGGEPAAHAQFQIASIHENRKGDPAGAIERFRKITVEPWKSQAAQRIAVMESRSLLVITPRAFRSGETATLKVSSRNLEKLVFSAYKLNPETYFRKKNALAGVESLDIGLVAADSEWTVPVPGYAKYKPVESDYELKIKTPGVFVVKVTDEKYLQATTLVVGSDLDAIVKASRDQLLVFVQDMKTGRGRSGAKVLISDGEKVVLEKPTGPDGVLLTDWENPRDPNTGITYLILDGGDVAGSNLVLGGQVAQGLSPRAFLYTDRPAYRPGQEVALRGVVRETAAGQYSNPAGESYRLEVYDSRGRMLVARPVKLSEFGTFHETLALDSAAPVGSYRIRLHAPGKSEFGGAFEVQAYQLEKVTVAFDLPKTVYFRGELVKAGILAKYQYGAPLANRPVEVQLPDGRVSRGMTDAAGKFAFEFPTEGFSEEQALRLVARLPQDNVAVSAAVSLAIKGFRIDLKTARDVFLDGERFRLSVSSIDALGKPIGRKLSAAVLKVISQGGVNSEREAVRLEVATDATSGKSDVALKVDDEEGGLYRLRVSGTDDFGNPIVSDLVVTISGKKDANKLRLLTDPISYKVGQEASVNLHDHDKGGAALLTWEADRILTYKIVGLKPGENPIKWTVDGAQFPNFTLTASRMADARFDEARLDLRVERDLQVSLRPTKSSVGPGDEVEVEVETRDQLGRPVSAEVGLALVDLSLLRLFEDSSQIGPYFYSQTRTGAFSTEATNKFQYQPLTVPTESAVVEEAERQQALAANVASRGEVRDQAKSQVMDFERAGRPRGGAAAAGSEPMLREGMTQQELTAAPASPSGALGYGGFGSAGAGQMGGMMMDGMAGMSGGMGGMMGRSARGLPSVASAPAPAPAPSRGAELTDGAAELPATSNFFVDSRLEPMARKQLGLFRRGAVQDDKAGATPTRERFVETAYWNPSIVTGKEGKTTVKLRAPGALSSYRFSAKGVTGSDTLVGQTSAELTVRKDFFVDIKTPNTLTQGDRPRVIGRLHHMGVTGAATAKLTVYAGGRQTVYPKTIELKGDGVEEILFDAFEAPDTDRVRLTLEASLGDKKDELVVETPTRPWGTQAFAAASGSSSDDATVFLGLASGRTYESPEMLVVVSPSMRRMIVELALGQDAFILDNRFTRCVIPAPVDSISERASDLQAACAALEYLRAVRGSDAPEAERLGARIQGLVSELTTLQNDDGGWPWVAIPNGPKAASDRTTSALASAALAFAGTLGMVSDLPAVDRAATFITQEIAKVESGDFESRAILLYALSTMRKATFEAANSLNRVRNSLPNNALAWLALSLANLERASLANEALDILVSRAKSEPVEPGAKPRKYWNADRQHLQRDAVETTAWVTLAFSKARPQSPELDAAVNWLQSRRLGFGWALNRAKGPAVSALASYHGKSRSIEDRYRLTVTVNDAEVYKADVVGAVEGKGILVPRAALKVGDKNRVRFHVEGRGTYGYAVTMTGFTRDFGPDQDRQGKPFIVYDREYLAAAPELDGKPLPTGFSTAVNPKTFANKVTSVGLGGRARVQINVYQYEQSDRPNWDRDFLIVEETLPAGATLIEGSVTSGTNTHSYSDGVLSVFVPPGQYAGTISYEVFGYLPGRYRSLPTKIRDAYDPGRSHLGPAGELRVLAPGETSEDPYRATPDELYAVGKARFQAGKLAEASAPLEELFGAYTLRDDVMKDAARMLLTIFIKDYQPRKVVQYFEIVKEKSPEAEIPFDEIAAVGRAYRDINEHERAYLVWRAIIEASYLEDARVGEVLRQRGKTLDSIAYLLDLWRSYPGTASIEADFLGIAQMLGVVAGKAINDPAIRSEAAEAGVTRSELILQNIRLIQTFLAQSPKNPMADEAGLALVGSFLELEDFASVVRLSARFATLYPKSTFQDGFQYSEALGQFHLGNHDRAVEVAEKIANAVYKDAAGVDQPSPNKWQAIYILGQIHDARRQPAKAVAYYEQVADRFGDAASAVKSLTRKDLTIPEVSIVRPGVKVANVGLNAVPPRATETREKAGVKLGYRNLAETEVIVYPVDLMRLYLSKRNLDEIADIDLAGITPLHQIKITLGNGEDFEDKFKEIDLPLEKEGAYLVMARGENLYASGIILVSPLELQVLEEADSGRVRVVVRDAKTKAFVQKVQVKVIGSENSGFLSGETDLRGVFVAEGIRGEVAVIARQDGAKYAFHQGDTHVGAPPVQSATPNPPQPAPTTEGKAAEDLGTNLKSLNFDNGYRQIDRLQNRYKDLRKGVISSDAY